ncbi:TRAP transporter substrate-binding protein [Polaromonas sp. JS666]|uniref:TRAP transporter substrate-binding protein n=1 Tax=Polaromonas sp. (strain JS666 / ATCC BAA-500) TaxID=296591 RepID=UPI000885EF71|nr:TRAP transporter substrate-binding protein [Polaromonas sp. JS666]SDM83900.1 TRAP-type C4-dicarboxylate transport system, substrate-binding protein [Polaromonas sp. JS666]
MKAILIAALVAAGAAHAQTSWKLATGYRVESFHTQNILQFGRDVDTATRGGLLIQVYPNNTLAKLADISTAVQQGKAEAGETIMTSMVKEMPLAGADSIPFVVTSYKDAQRLWKLQRPGLEKHFSERGLKLLYAVPWPPQGLHSNKPVRGPTDFRGTQMRTYNQTTLRIAEMLGAKPVDVAMVDVGKALAEGRMDNMITSALTGVENKVWGPIKYYYEINAWFPKNAVFVSNKAFDALKPEARAAVLKAAAEAEVRGWQASQALAASATEELRANGVKIERISPELDQEIKRMGEKFSREWIRSVGNEANDIFVPYYMPQ